MKKIAFAVLAILLLIGGVFYTVHLRKGGNQVAAIAMARNPVATTLKDPASAQYRNEQLKMNGAIICGEVNAKNSLGGYVGFKRYISDGKNYVVEGNTFESWPTQNIKPPPPIEIAKGIDIVNSASSSGLVRSGRTSDAIAEALRPELFGWFWRNYCATS